MHWIWLIRDRCRWNFRNFCAIKTKDCWVLIILHEYLKKYPLNTQGKNGVKFAEKIACNLYHIIWVRSDIMPYCSLFTNTGSNSVCKSFYWSQNNTQFTSYWNIWPLQSWLKQSQKEIMIYLVYFFYFCSGYVEAAGGKWSQHTCSGGSLMPKVQQCTDGDDGRRFWIISFFFKGYCLFFFFTDNTLLRKIRFRWNSHYHFCW